MKTTLELPDALLRAAKKLAVERGTTLRSLLEAGLRAVLDERARPKRFRLKDASVGGKGLRAPFREDRWDEIRDAAYESRGG